MWGRAAFDRSQLLIAPFRCVVALASDRYDRKLSYYVLGVSVASFGEELCFRQSSSS